MYRSVHPNDPGMHNTFYSDRYEFTHNSSKPTQIKKMKQNFVCLLLGLALIIASIVLIVWNEERAIYEYLNLEEGLNSVKELSFTGVSQEENENRLVYLTGKLFTDNVIKDEEFGVSVHAAHLKRKVQMFQWIQSEVHTINRDEPESSPNRIEVSYAYEMEWSDDLVNSNTFHVKVGHMNPVRFPVQTHLFSAAKCKIGQFSLSPGLMKKLSNYFVLTDLGESSKPGIKFHQGMYYKMQNPNGNVAKPQIGDIRIQYLYAGKTGGNAETVSVVAKQHNLNLLPFETNQGKIIELLYYGQVGLQDIWVTEGNHNYAFIVLVRCIIWLCAFFSFTCLFNLLSVISRKITLIRMISITGTYSLRIVFSNTLTFSIGAFMWFPVHSLTSALLLILVFIPYVFAVIKMRFRYNSSHRNV